MKFKKDESLFIGRIKSMGFAAKGAFKLLTTEHSVILQFSIAIIMVVAGFYFNITKEEWLAQTLATGMVLGIEGVNTALEKTADFIHPEYHEKIGFIKDIAAGAVFFAAITAIAVGAIIYIPYLV